MDCKHSKMFVEENSQPQQQQQQQLAKATAKSVQQLQQQQYAPVQTQTPLLHPLLLQDRSCLPLNQLPIDDFHLLENPNKYGEDEKQLRIKLTAVYRLIELNGWSMGIYNHVTVSICQLQLAFRRASGRFVVVSGLKSRSCSLTSQPASQSVSLINSSADWQPTWLVSSQVREVRWQHVAPADICGSQSLVGLSPAADAAAATQQPLA